ncbi:MAG: CoA-binding protein [Candidatus Humimicrobiia bacterium]
MNELKKDSMKTVAVVGVSKDEKKFGFRVFKDMIKKGQKVYGINPKADFILGQKIFSKIQDIPEKPDLVITVVSPKVTEKIVDECISLSIKEIWMQPGSESEKAIEKAESNGISVIHDACIIIETNKDEDLLLKL